MLKFAARAGAGLALAVACFIALGGLMSAASQPPLRGRLVDVGGHHMHIVCAGPQSDQPLVLFEAGAFGFSADWAVVQGKLAERGVRSCAYDRAGLGRSEPGPKPRDGLAIASDLEKLLAAADLPGPYVLVGHSMAGLHVRLFAVRNPGEVAGIVLVDAPTPEATDHPLVRRFIGSFAAASRLAGWGASAGLFKPLAPVLGDKIGLTPEASREKRRAFASGPHNRTAAQEVGLWITDARQAREAGAYDPAWPVAVVTAGPVQEGQRAAWKAMQAAPARASRHPYVENVEAAGHASLLGLDFAEPVVRGVLHVLEAAQTEKAARSVSGRPS